MPKNDIRKKMFYKILCHIYQIEKMLMSDWDRGSKGRNDFKNQKETTNKITTNALINLFARIYFALASALHIDLTPLRNINLCACTIMVQFCWNILANIMQMAANKLIIMSTLQTSMWQGKYIFPFQAVQSVIIGFTSVWFKSIKEREFEKKIQLTLTFSRYFFVVANIKQIL